MPLPFPATHQVYAKCMETIRLAEHLGQEPMVASLEEVGRWVGNEVCSTCLLRQLHARQTQEKGGRATKQRREGSGMWMHGH